MSLEYADLVGGPGRGRSEAARVLAETTDAARIARSGTAWFLRLAELYVFEDEYRELGITPPDLLRREIAQALVRVSIARRAIRLQAKWSKETCANILDAAREPR